MIIDVDGQPFHALKTLDDPLRGFSFTKNEPRALWVDQICTSQSQAQERSHQAMQMKKIYEHAKKVLVWLHIQCTSEESSETIDY
jgi:hypothetical protein